MIQQIGDGTPFSIRAEWSNARRRGHSGLTQLTDLCCLRDLMMMMMTVGTASRLFIH